jgi:rhomboid protease GluP
MTAARERDGGATTPTTSSSLSTADVPDSLPVRSAPEGRLRSNSPADAPETQPAQRTFVLRRTPPRRGLAGALSLLVLGVAPAVLLPLAWFVATRAVSPLAALAVALACGLLSVAWLGWHFLLPRPMPVAVVSDAVVFPLGRGRVRILLHEVLVARVEQNGIMIFSGVAPGQTAGGDVGVFFLPRRCFLDPESPERLLVALRSALGQLPEAARLLARWHENDARQRAFTAKRPLVTMVTVGLCVVVFLVEWRLGALDDVAVLVRLGANEPLLSLRGEPWRWVSACVLHAGVLHLVMNLSSLWSLGALTERFVGGHGFFLVLFASGVGGHLASAFAARAALSVGISGAIFGLLGVLLVSSWRFRGQRTGGLRVPLSSWLFLLVANGLLATLPFIDVFAHGAGFAVGVVVGALVTPGHKHPAPLGPAARRWLSWACLALTLLALGFAVAHAL